MSSNLRWNIDIDLSTDNALQAYQRLVDDAIGGSISAQKKLNNALGGKEVKQFSLQYDSNLGKEIPVAKTILTEFKKIEDSVAKRNKIEDGSLTKLRAQLRQATQARDQIARLKTTTDQYKNTVTKTTTAWKKQDKVVRDLNKRIADASGNWMKMIQARIPGGQNIMAMANGLTQIGFAVGGVVAGFQAINQAIGPVVARTKQLQSLDLAFQGFGLSAEQSAQFMDQAKAQAFKYGASLNRLEQGYKRIAPAIMNSGGSMQDVSDVMASLSARSTTLGLNTEQSGRYFEAFAQVMGKGKLQGEELNQQFSELDGALRGQVAAYMEATHGITDFEGAMQKGQITSALFMEAFNAISEDMRNNLAGSITEVQARIDDLNVQQIQNISDNLNAITLESLGDTFGDFGKQMMSVKLMLEQFLANIATTMPGVQQVVKAVMAVIGGAIQATVVGALGLLRFLLHGIEFVVNGWMLLGEAFLKFVNMIPGGKQVIDALTGTFKNVVEGLQNFTDGWLGVGSEALKAEQELSQTDGRIVALQNRFREGKIDADEFAEGLKRINDEAANAALGEEYDTLMEKIGQLKEKIKEATSAQDGAKSIFDAEKEKVEQLKLGVKNFFDEKKAALKVEKDEVTARYDSEIAAIKRAQDAAKARHEDEMNALQARNSQIQAGIQSEIDALGGKTPAEEKLAQLRKQEIMDKLASGELSEKEKLQLQAQLERMQRQKQIQEAQLRLKSEKENADKAEAALAEKQKTEQEELANAEKAAQEDKKAALEEIKTKQAALMAQQERMKDLFDKSKDAVDLTGKSMGEIATLVKNQVSDFEDAKTSLENAETATEGLKNELEQAEGNADALKSAMEQVAVSANNAKNSINSATTAQRNLNNARSSGGGGGGGGGNPLLAPRASGGPVSGGTAYQVNELGREGFVTKGGRMSEITAPSYGAWKAPSSGSVIPAHVWAAIKAQSGSGSSATPRAVNGTGGLMSQIRNMGTTGSSDVVTNNVTIQSDNVDRTLQQSLVSLRRSKRSRYY